MEAVMHKLTFYIMLLLVSGCSYLPPASELTLMAAGNFDKSQKKNLIIDFVCINSPENNTDQKNYREIYSSLKYDNSIFSESEHYNALKLVTSGKFKSDLEELVILTLSLAPKATYAVSENVKLLKDIPVELSSCLAWNCSDPQMALDVALNVYGSVFGPSAELSRQTFIALLENQTFRLALIYYARSNGVNIDDSDLSFAHRQLLKQEIDISELIEKGKEKAMSEYGISGTNSKIPCLENNSVNWFNF